METENKAAGKTATEQSVGVTETQIRDLISKGIKTAEGITLENLDSDTLEILKESFIKSLMNSEKEESDKFNLSRPNNVKIMEKYKLDTMCKIRYCENCKKKQIWNFFPKDHEDIAHWECQECGEVEQ